MVVYLKSQCKMSWKFISSFSINERLRKIEIQGNPGYSLQTGEDDYVVHFKDTLLIIDLALNKLSTDTIQARILRYLYMSNTEQGYSEGIGSVFNSSSLITFGLMIFISLFQSASVAAFWSFLNMVQQLSYLPTLNCLLPSNLSVFLIDYMNVKKMAIPLELLPDFELNPLNYMADFLIAPFSEQFSFAGYESLSFIFNFVDELLTWFLLCLLYILLSFLCSLTTKSKFFLC
eukprot:TRINITY_DN14188_c0_g3_i1.p2 TRINITY_DN14188_c0_g3~~TRINITY_DN14188_c0_g3_i1.p2  ORF type:complete len:232 (-),score=31.38 TRINITY_DN14188_c0_g3_i1:70-765(-)